ncbi:hypothetical protein ACLESO_52765, partial [Pyxidicoccus sp. 3LG]
PGAKVGAGARVERAAIFEDTEVAPGESLSEVLRVGEAPDSRAADGAVSPSYSGLLAWGRSGFPRR